MGRPPELHSRIHKAFLDSIPMKLLGSKCKLPSINHIIFIFTFTYISCSGPTTVLACSLMFIGLVVVLHILGEFRSL